MRPRVYISGPITRGNRTENFRQACNAQAALMGEGFAVMNPMLTMMHPEAWTIEHSLWMENDLPWVAVSHVVYRLPGESVGGDMECAHAMNLGIPVFTKYSDVIDWKNKWAKNQLKTIANGT